MRTRETRDAVVIGAGPAGLSAAIYLARALHTVTIVHHGRPMLAWEPDMQNYLGFPQGIHGEDLLERGVAQAHRFGAETVEAEVTELAGQLDDFRLETTAGTLRARRVLIATGIYHRPPDIPGVSECLGHSLFFCKDCDGWRVRDQAIAIFGRNDDAVEYALGMLAYSPRVLIATNNEAITWDDEHAGWIEAYGIPVHTGRIEHVEHEGNRILGLAFEGGRRIAVDVAFTTRGDLVHNQLALAAGAAIDPEGQIAVDAECRTSVPGLFAAGCVTPANCQAIVAAGQGAMAAQAMRRDLWCADIRSGALLKLRDAQRGTMPEVLG